VAGGEAERLQWAREPPREVVLARWDVAGRRGGGVRSEQEQGYHESAETEAPEHARDDLLAAERPAARAGAGQLGVERGGGHRVNICG
jgi:hypothetical protein